MDIRSFLNFIKKHRLSINYFWEVPKNQKNWNLLFYEGIRRNNTVLLNDLILQCPTEFKVGVFDFIKNEIFNFSYSPKKPFSNNILKWVFNTIEPSEFDIAPRFLARNSRDDVISYLLKNNNNNKYDSIIFKTLVYLSSKGNLELFSKITDNIDIFLLLEKFKVTEDVYDKNIFLNLFHYKFDQETYFFLHEKQYLKKDDYFKILKKIATNKDDFDLNIKNSFLFEQVLLSIPQEVMNDIKNEILNKNSKLIFNLFYFTSVIHCKILKEYDILSSSTLSSAITNIIANKDNNNILNSMNFLFNNFTNKELDNIYNKEDFFKKLIFNNHFNCADLIISKHPEVLNEHIKDDISLYFLNNYLDKKDDGIFWALNYLTSKDIDLLIDKNINQFNLGKLTNWKCEHFIYHNQKISKEKSKIKI